MRVAWFLTVVVSLAWFAACGGGTSSSLPSNPIFTSTPGTQATQGQVYSYGVAATDPAGGIVSFSLTTGPKGASLKGNTLTWTPVASQSRASSNFTVIAKTPSGGSATQSWTVTPSGTIIVNWVDTYGRRAVP